MTCYSQRAGALTAGIWLIGLGIMLATKTVWPWVLFLVGISVIVQGWFSGGQRQAIRGAILAIAIGVWAACKFNVALLFVGLGAYIIYVAVINPQSLRKPYVDNTLE
jgi:hydrogenase/urease accessory protein HupE